MESACYSHAVNTIFAHWKSTVSGILTVLLSTITALLALPNVQTLVSPKTLLYMGAFSAIGKVWVSLITKDAGTVPAMVPGKEGIQNVPAHEVPDNPSAVAIPASQTTGAKP